MGKNISLYTVLWRSHPENKMVELPVDFQTGSIFRKLTQMLGPYIFPRELESQVNRVAFCVLVIGTNIKQIEQHLIFFS